MGAVNDFYYDQAAMTLLTLIPYSGKGLGGSSGMNFMPWQKPPKEEIDGECILTSTHKWGIENNAFPDLERLGNPGWNWNNYQKYCHKVER